MLLRPARAEDCRLYWEWANEAGVRDASFRSEAIAWDEHAAWFERRLGEATSMLLVAESEDGEPLGQIRFEGLDEGACEVHLSVASAARGRGLGTALLRESARTLADRGIGRVVAHVKPDNAASLRMFEKAGFVRVGAGGAAVVRLEASVADLLQPGADGT